MRGGRSSPSPSFATSDGADPDSVGILATRPWWGRGRRGCGRRRRRRHSGGGGHRRLGHRRWGRAGRFRRVGPARLAWVVRVGRHRRQPVVLPPTPRRGRRVVGRGRARGCRRRSGDRQPPRVVAVDEDPAVVCESLDRPVRVEHHPSE